MSPNRLDATMTSYSCGWLDAVERADWAQVHVLVEPLPDGDQQPPQRLVVGDVWPADGAVQDGVMVGEDVQPVGGHHAAVGDEVVAAPVQPFPLDRGALEA